MRQRRGTRVLHLIVAVATLAVGLALVAPAAQAEVEVGRTTFPNSLSGVGVDPDDGAVYVQEFVAPAKVHKVVGGVVVSTVTLSGGPGRLAYDSVRNRIYVTQISEGRVLAINADTMSVVGTVTTGGAPVGVEVDEISGKVAVALNQTGQLKVFDGPSMSTLATVSAGSGAIYLAIAPGGNTVYVSNQANSVTRHEAPSYATTGSFGANAPNEMVLDPASSRLYLGTQNEGVVVIDTTTLSRIGSVQLGGRALAVALTGGGSRIVVAMSDEQHLAVVDTATLTQIGVVGNIITPVYMTTNPANDHVFSVGGNGGDYIIELAPSTPPDPLPTVSVNDGIVVEGDPGVVDPNCPWWFGCYQNDNHPQPVLLTLDEPSNEWVKVQYTFGNPGSATPNTDYSAYTYPAFIPPGETSLEVNFTTIGDTAVEPDEDATFSIVSAVGATVGTATAAVTIIDDDVPAPPQPVVALSGDVVADEGEGAANVDVYLDGPASADVTVDWTATPGTAGSPDDFVELSGSFTVPAGDTIASFPVTLADDTLQEPDESFTVALSGIAGPATLDPATAQVTIADDDTPPSVLTLGPNVSVTEGTGTGATATVQVLLSRPASGDLELFWSADGTSASSPADFAGGSNSLLVPAGATTASISVPVVGDSVDEFNEMFAVTLTDALGNAVLGARTSANVSITDDDAVPSVTVADVSAGEGDALTFTLALSSPSSKTAAVRYATANGTALAADFSSRVGTASFAPGATSVTVTVPTTEDATQEPDETVRLLLSNASQLTIGDSLAIGTIVDDDQAPTVGVSSRSILEGNTGTKTLGLTVSLSAPTTQAVTVTVATQDVTAVSSGVRDFTAKTQTFTFNPGQTTKTFNVTIVGDRRVEPDESFDVIVQSVTGPAGGQGNRGTGTIVNND